MALHRWLYQGGRPKGLTKIINLGWAFIHSLGFFPNYLVTLEVTGRLSGKSIRFPLVMVILDGERYLVSMLGNEANWVRNVKASGGKAMLHHGKVEEVLLEEVDVRNKASILKAYLQIAPGARPHMMVDKDAPAAAFEAICAYYPVFRVVITK